MATNQLVFPNPLKGVLIDLDGTLIDHFEALYRSYQHVTTKLGYPVPTKAQVKRAIGGSMPVTIREFIPAKDLEQAIDLWRNFFETIYLEKVEFMPGAMRLLETLKAQNLSAAVFTNKIGVHARGLCNALGATPYLNFVLGAEDTPYRKPQVEFSRCALDRLATKAKETILIGDSPFDIQAAHCAGMTSFTVPTGSHTRNELVDAGSHAVFNSLEEIVLYLEDNN